MAQIVKLFKDVAGKVNLLPVTGLIFFHRTGTSLGVELESSFTKFYQLESESNWKLDPKLRKRDDGNDIILGYTLSAVIYVPHNQYQADGILERMEAIMTDCRNKKPPQVILSLGNNKVNSPETPANIINYTSDAEVDFGVNPSVTYNIETTDLRPRMIININAFIKDILTSWFGAGGTFFDE